MVFVCVYVYVREGLGVGGKGVLKNCLGGGGGGVVEMIMLQMCL